jgi:hypothetical protein
MVWILDENGEPTDGPFSGCCFAVSDEDDFLFEQFLWLYETTRGQDFDYLVPFSIIERVASFVSRARAEKEIKKQWQKPK